MSLWNPKPVHQIDGDFQFQTDETQIDPAPIKPKPRPTQTTALSIDIAGLDTLMADVKTLRASVWETTSKTEQLKTQVDNVETSLREDIQRLRDQQDRIETMLTGFFPFIEEKQQLNREIKAVCRQITEYLRRA